MKAVIFAGGLGTRMREETNLRPKPMVDIGGRPVLWHLMKIYSHYGINDFIILAGYKSEIIKTYFMNFDFNTRGVTVKLGSPGTFHFVPVGSEEWTVTVLDTGENTLTGERLIRAQDVIGNETFHCTYGDGLAPVDIAALQISHELSGKVATMTVTQPSNRFGVVEFDRMGVVTSFREKPKMTDWVNIGFFCFHSEIFDFLTPNEALEDSALQRVAAVGELTSNKHEGFWEPMDTYREYQALNRMWESGSAPWKVW